MLIHCDCCGVEFDCSPSRYNKSKTHCCSKKCMNTLMKEYEVHHIDGNKLNNNPNNLMVATKSEHRAIHNYLSPRQHDELGRFK